MKPKLLILLFLISWSLPVFTQDNLAIYGEVYPYLKVHSEKISYRVVHNHLDSLPRRYFDKAPPIMPGFFCEPDSNILKKIPRKLANQPLRIVHEKVKSKSVNSNRIDGIKMFDEEMEVVFYIPLYAESIGNHLMEWVNLVKDSIRIIHEGEPERYGQGRKIAFSRNFFFKPKKRTDEFLQQIIKYQIDFYINPYGEERIEFDIHNFWFNNNPLEALMLDNPKKGQMVKRSCIADAERLVNHFVDFFSTGQFYLLEPKVIFEIPK